MCNCTNLCEKLNDGNAHIYLQQSSRMNHIAHESWKHRVVEWNGLCASFNVEHSVWPEELDELFLAGFF